MTTSIMFVTYNRLSLTQKMLESLFKNTNSLFRLIIIDNGSTDGTVEWLKRLTIINKQCISYDVSFNEKNLGIAVGRNQALVMANKYGDEWMSTLDNDVELPMGWLEECIDILQANPTFVMGLNMEGILYPIIEKNGKMFQYKPQGNLGTACTVFNKQLHKSIGYFTTEFGLYGEEDADFFFRARLVGYEMGYIRSMGIHLGQGSLDVGEYREFKNQCHANNLNKFRQNCLDYMNKKKQYFIKFENE